MSATPGQKRPPTPWGLTLREQQVLDMVCIKGCHDETAKSLHIARVQVSRALAAARQRMSQPNTIRALIEWDRFAMGRDESEAT